MKKIVFDSNFLIDLARFRIDIEEIKNLVGLCEFYTVDLVVNELKRIAGKKAKASRNARVALKLMELNDFKIIKSKGKNADDAILKLAGKDTVVATNDIELRKSLKKIRAKTIYLRAKKHLAIN